ncbi:MAG: hypothetical protein AMXMBFR75_32190 [Candidatus Hinthialibacteria bacterium]
MESKPLSTPLGIHSDRNSSELTPSFAWQGPAFLLVLAFFIETSSLFGIRAGWFDNPLVGGCIKVSSNILLIVAVLVVFVRLKANRNTFRLVTTAFILIMINRLTRLTRYIPFVVQIPVMGTDSPVRFAIETVSITAGYLLLIGTFFTILRQLQVSEHKSARRAGELAAEIEERKRISAALHRHEERYRLLFEGNNDGILLIGMNHEIEVFNAQMEKMLGYSLEEISDLKPAAIVHSDYQAIFSTTLESFLANQPVRRTVEIPLCCKDGSQLETEASFDLIKSDKEPIGVQVIFRDISDRKELEEERKTTEEQIQHARRLESLITMAGGIAHDFNNLLQAIIGHVEMIRMSLTEASPIKEDVERIHQAAWQAAVLTNRMLSYSGRGGFFNQALDLNEVIRKNETQIAQSANSHIQLQYDLAPGPITIWGDPNQVRDMLLNLVTNAAEAINHDQGEILIRTGVWIPPKGGVVKCIMGKVLPCETFSFLEVADNGCGMDEQTQKLIFDPFFSTKFIGRGLGLPAVQGMVRGMRGSIQVDSAIGKGTTLRILFPPAPEKSEEPLPDRV